MHRGLSGGIRASNGIDCFASTGYSFGGSTAVIDTRSLQAFDPGHVQGPPLHAHRKQERVAGNLETVGKFQETVGTFRSDAHSLLGSEDFHTESACLGHGAAGEIASAESGRKTEIVLDPGAEPCLAARCFAFDHHRAQALAGAVNSRSESSRAASDNGEVIEAGFRVSAQADLVDR